MPRVLDVHPNFGMAPDQRMPRNISGPSSTAQEPVLPNNRLDTEVSNDIAIQFLSSKMLPLNINTKCTVPTTPKRHRPISPIADSCVRYNSAKSILLPSLRSPEASPAKLLSIERMDRLLKLRRRRSLQHFRDATRDENPPRDGPFLRKRLFDKENNIPEGIFFPSMGNESENVLGPSRFSLKPRINKRKPVLPPRSINRPTLQSIENRPNFPKAA